MDKDSKIHFHKNLEYLCKKNIITKIELKKKLGIKGPIKSIESFIKICNYFDVVADDILFNTLNGTKK